MNKTFFIKPATDTPVRDPETFKPLEKEGEDKPRNEYWLRRQLDGLVAELDPPKAKSKTTKGDK